MKVTHIAGTKLSNCVRGARECWGSHERGGEYHKATDNINDADMGLLSRLINKHRHMSIIRHATFLFSVKKEDIIGTSAFLPLIGSRWTTVTEDSDSYIISTNYQAIMEMGIDINDKLSIIPQTMHWLVDGDIGTNGVDDSCEWGGEDFGGDLTVELLDFTDVDQEKYKEHLTYTFRVTNFPRAVLQESSRHVTMMPSVRSSRYTLKELGKEESFFAVDEEGVGIDFKRAYKYIYPSGDQLVDIASFDALERLRELIKIDKKSIDIVKMALVESYKTNAVFTIQHDGLLNLVNLRTADSALIYFRQVVRRIYDKIPEKHKHLYADALHEEEI